MNRAEVVRREQRGIGAARTVVAGADAAREDGLVAATRVDMAAVVTHVALQRAAGLSELEARLVTRSPVGAARYQHLVDAFTAVAASEIDGLGVGWQVNR